MILEVCTMWQNGFVIQISYEWVFSKRKKKNVNFSSEQKDYMQICVTDTATLFQCSVEYPENLVKTWFQKLKPFHKLWHQSFNETSTSFL